MNKLYLFLIVCVGVLFAACSDDDDFNTAEALVSMKQPVEAEMDSVKENKLFKVPVVLTGKQNGPVKVTVEVVSNSPDYVEDVDYIVTSKTVTIPANKQEVGVEIQLVDDREINDALRVLTVKIISVVGAKIDDAKSSVMVKILDNDANPYDRMAGIWTVTMIDGFSGSGIQWETEIVAYDDTEEQYGNEYVMQPLIDVSGMAIEVETGYVGMPMKFKSYKVDGKETVELKVRCGTVVAEGVNFDATADQSQPDLQACRLRIVSLGATGIISNSADITGKVNDTYDRIEFDMPILCEIVTKTNQPYSYMFYYTNMTMTLKN